MTSRPRWSITTKALVSALLIGFFIYLLVQFRVVIPPIVIASILAYILSPLVSRIETRVGGRRWLATVIVYLILIGLLAIGPALVIPPLVDRISGLSLAFEEIFGNLEAFASQTISIGGVAFDGAQLVTETVNTLRTLLEPLFGRTLDFAFSLISSLVTGVFVLVISFYLVKDGRVLRAWLHSLPPPGYRQDFLRLLEEIDRMWTEFFRGQLVLALIVGAIFTVAGFVIGMPFALAMGLFAGLLEFIPSIGHTIWIVTASLLAIFQGSTWLPIPNWAMWVLVFGLHNVFVWADLNILMPRIIGRRVRLHPLIVILGIIAGASVAGVLGVVIAAPTIATGRVLGRYLFANLLDYNPFETA
jgi:predicted PurR-regulated permease PerM